MNKLQRQAEKAYSVLQKKREGVLFCDEDNCENCPADETIDVWCDDEDAMKIWLLNNGFPASRPHVHTTKSLGEKIKAGYSKSTLVLWLNDHVDAVECPDCEKQVLYRETRKRCAGCGKIYPAERWAAGEPCGCGSVDAKYAGCHTANRFGGLEYQLCETPGCRYSSPYAPLTIQELADKVEEAANDQL